MYKQYFNSMDGRRLKEKSDLMFKEVSTGIYHVEKDRLGYFSDYLNGYVNSDEVTDSLREDNNVVVIGSGGILANFELEESRQYK